jgi:hypothetical protein
MTTDVKEHFPIDGSAPYLEVTSDKRAATYRVQKTQDGFALFKVAISKGALPKELTGVYTSPKLALKDIEFYLTYQTKSSTIKVKENREAYKKSKVEV